MTHAQLETPSDLIANTARTILVSDPGFPLPVYAHRYFGAMAVNRVEVSAAAFELGSDHIAYANIANVSTPYYDHRKGRLAFTVITARNDQQTTDNHALALGRIGYLMSRPAQRWTPANVANLVILDLEDNGESPSEEEKTDTDRTTRSYSVEYIIPPTVYESAT